MEEKNMSPEELAELRLQSGKMKKKLIIAIVAVILILAVAIVAIFIAKRQGTKDSDLDKSNTGSGEADTSDGIGSDTPDGIPESSEGLVFELNSDGRSYTVTGIGSCKDPVVIIGKYNGLPVTKIGSYAFKGCMTMSSVVISSCVTEMEQSAFTSCLKVIEVVNNSSIHISKEDAVGGTLADFALDIHTGYSRVDNQNGYLFYTFEDKTYLLDYVGSDTELTLPDSYNGRSYEIYKYAFYDKDNITGIKLSEGVTAINSANFSCCDALSYVELPSTLKYVGINVFYECPALSFTEYGDARYLGNTDNKYLYLHSATGTDVTSVNAHENTKFIGDSAFENCLKLRTVTLPDGLLGISQYAFSNTDSLYSLSLPDSILYLAENAFSDTSISEITIPSGISELSGDLFFGSTLRRIKFTNNVKTIRYSAFYLCQSLTTIDFSGTKSDWASIVKEQNWDYYTPSYTVYCTDGEIKKQ